MLKIALCQTKVFIDKTATLESVAHKISEAANKGAKIIALPEMFNCPYSGRNFPIYADDEKNSTTLEFLKNHSVKEGIYLIGGSIPEMSNGRIYNTSYVIDPMGNVIAKHRKIHLFDVDIKGGTSFCESEYLSPGEQITMFDSEFGKIGLCICYDIRFPELLRRMTLNGCKIIFVPAAFGMTTGPAHWELLFRSRAMDNQIYLAGISPARDCEGKYKPYGHTLVANPWGDIIASAGEDEEIVYADIDFDYLETVRQELPVLRHRKPEVY